MVVLSSLWLPILIAAALVFVMSSLVWMVLPHHRSDFAGLPREDDVLDALGGAAPGSYDFPHADSLDELKTPEMRARFEKGPVGFVTVAPGSPNMGKNLGVWFVYCLFVGWVVAYVLTRTLPPGAEYWRVFQVGGTVAWAAYGFGTISDSIWFSRPWKRSFKQLFDALLYGLLTGGALAGFWP